VHFANTTRIACANFSSISNAQAGPPVPSGLPIFPSPAPPGPPGAPGPPGPPGPPGQSLSATGPIATLGPAFLNQSAAATSGVGNAVVTSATSFSEPSGTSVPQPNKSASPQLSNDASSSQMAKGLAVLGSLAAGLWSVL
jgi:hypothetical protein